MNAIHERCLSVLNADGTCPACDDRSEDDQADDMRFMLAESFLNRY